MKHVYFKTSYNFINLKKYKFGEAIVFSIIPDDTIIYKYLNKEIFCELYPTITKNIVLDNSCVVLNTVNDQIIAETTINKNGFNLKDWVLNNKKIEIVLIMQKDIIKFEINLKE